MLGLLLNLLKNWRSEERILRRGIAEPQRCSIYDVNILRFEISLCSSQFVQKFAVSDRSIFLDRKFKSREVAQPLNNVITGFTKSIVLNTLIYSWTLAPPDGWSGALPSALWY